MSYMNLENLSVGYDNNVIIENICLQVKAGNIVVLVGPNGAGKSTILKTIAGLLQAVSGDIFINGDSLMEIAPNARAQKLSSMMTSRFSTEYMTVREVVAAARYPYTGLLGKMSEEDIQIIDNALITVGAFEQNNKEFVKLSDGQKQRVLLARAIAQKPEFMILDEPTSYLDIGYKLSFIETLKKLSKDDNIGIIMSLHEIELTSKAADIVVCISKDGRIDKIGTPGEVFTTSYIEALFDVKKGLLKEIYNFSPVNIPVSQIKTKLNNPKAKFLMIQGTMSGAGKSLMVAGLCRILHQDGFKVAPFKSQNMALNSFITEEGLEMGRAQVMQAEAAGIKPSVYMNPILLKPTSDSGSQVIVNGKVRGNMRAREYFEYKTTLVDDIIDAIEKLQKQSDIIIIEGAGSPAEINLKSNDIVNMGMARMVDAPVLLVGDIDRGGVFAQLLGTIELLDEEERQRIKGLVVNKFRGDKSILDSGLQMLKERSDVPIAGVVPYMNLNLEDEDSLSDKLDRKRLSLVNIGVVKLPHMSNYTDFDVFEQLEEVAVRYIHKAEEVERMDMIILPGTKNTIEDMKWLKESGMETAIRKYHSKEKPIVGICGGYQMLGVKISDPYVVESGGEAEGLSLLPVETVLAEQKHRRQVKGIFSNPTGLLSELKGKEYSGYEIHMGVTQTIGDELKEFTSDSSGYCQNNVWGSYIHGMFDNADIVKSIVYSLAKIKGIDIDVDKVMDYRDLKDKEFDRLAEVMRQHMDMNLIYSILEVSAGGGSEDF